MHKVKVIGFWALKILMGLLMMLAGFGKFQQAEVWATNFQQWGLPAGFHLVIGALELLAGLALFIPRITLCGAAVLLMIMIGATTVHVLSQSGLLSLGLHLLLMLWLGAIIKGHWPRKAPNQVA